MARIGEALRFVRHVIEYDTSSVRLSLFSCPEDGAKTEIETGWEGKSKRTAKKTSEKMADKMKMEDKKSAMMEKKSK